MPALNPSQKEIMSEVTVKTRENGPILITGPITLIDHLGNKFDLSGKENVALCRCGQSSKRPFCDGTHRTCGFVANETVPTPHPS
jgi:CDGSH-type Zn-finger protein